jgi:hypothetical protein
MDKFEGNHSVLVSEIPSDTNSSNVFNMIQNYELGCGRPIEDYAYSDFENLLKSFAHREGLFSFILA